MFKKFLRKIVIITCVMICGLAMLSYFSPSTPKLGVTDGRLSECPPGPNCVSSMTSSEDHFQEPIPFAILIPTNSVLPSEGQTQRLKELIAANFAQATLIEDQEDYLRYEFRTFIFRFVDDVELLVDSEQKVIHFRSASRVGKSDLGANRKRMEKIKGLMAKQ